MVSKHTKKEFYNVYFSAIIIIIKVIKSKTDGRNM